MDSFFQEYGFVVISIAAMAFLFYFFMVLPTQYANFELQLMSQLTGVPVQDMVDAEQAVRYAQENH